MKRKVYVIRFSDDWDTDVIVCSTPESAIKEILNVLEYAGIFDYEEDELLEELKKRDKAGYRDALILTDDDVESLGIRVLANYIH